jgi:hypothetical protein
MINFNHMFNSKLIMLLDLIIWLSKFSSVSINNKLNNGPQEHKSYSDKLNNGPQEYKSYSDKLNNGPREYKSYSDKLNNGPQEYKSYFAMWFFCVVVFLLVFVLCLVTYVACFSGLSILHCTFVFSFIGNNAWFIWQIL